MTAVGVIAALGPAPKLAAALLAERPGHPLALERPAATGARFAGVAALAAGPAWEATAVVPGGGTPGDHEGPAEALATALAEARVLNVGSAQEALAEDGLEQAAWLLGLAERFRLPAIGCRLTWAAHRGQPCRKLHRDTMPLRLVTTYLGPGTEWVLDEACLGLEDVPPGTALVQAAPFVPLLLPGKLAPAGLAPGVIHRSPLPDGEALRLVLRVDLLVAPQG